MRRVLAATAMVLGTLAGCHLVGGLDGLAVDPEEGAGASGGTPTGAVGPGGTGGATSSSSSTGGSMGGGLPACDEATCGQESTECTSCNCATETFCDCNPVASGTACSTGVCFDGGCVQCITSVDCTNGGTCNIEAKVCEAASCTDMEVNGGETDLNCGGPNCAPCPNDDSCLANNDCQSGYCAGVTCEPCTQNSDCNGDRYCDGGTCVPKKGSGGGCYDGLNPMPEWCLSGQCCPIGCQNKCLGFCCPTCDCI